MKLIRKQTALSLLEIVIFIVLLLPISTSIAQHSIITITPTPPLTSTPIVTNSIFSLAWSPDGSKIAVGMGTDYCHPDNPDLYKIQILDALTGQTLITLSGTQCDVSSLDWSPDGTKVASASLDHVGVRIWDATTGRIVISAQGHGQGLVSIKWSPDGAKLADTSIGNGIGILDATTGEILSFAPIGGTVIDWNPDGSKLVSGSAYENQVYVADMINEQPLMNLSGHTDLVSAVDWSPDGSKLASGSADATVRIWDAITGAALFTLQGHTDFVTEVEWSPDTSKIASSSNDGTVRIWDAKTGEQLRLIQGNGRIYAIVWNPNGQELAYGGLNDSLQIVSVPDLGDSQPKS